MLNQRFSILGAQCTENNMFFKWLFEQKWNMEYQQAEIVDNTIVTLKLIPGKQDSLSIDDFRYSYMWRKDRNRFILGSCSYRRQNSCGQWRASHPRIHSSATAALGVSGEHPHNSANWRRVPFVSYRQMPRFAALRRSANYRHGPSKTCCPTNRYNSPELKFFLCSHLNTISSIARILLEFSRILLPLQIFLYWCHTFGTGRTKEIINVISCLNSDADYYQVSIYLTLKTLQGKYKFKVNLN